MFLGINAATISRRRKGGAGAHLLQTYGRLIRLPEVTTRDLAPLLQIHSDCGAHF
jgi:hypothetical protein